MRITDRSHKLYFKQIIDYYPVINPYKLQKGTNISIPSKEDIQAAKDWVDTNHK